MIAGSNLILIIDFKKDALIEASFFMVQVEKICQKVHNIYKLICKIRLKVKQQVNQSDIVGVEINT